MDPRNLSGVVVPEKEMPLLELESGTVILVHRADDKFQRFNRTEGIHIQRTAA